MLSMFHDHDIEKIKSELGREADAICRIVLEEYMDDAKRPVAKEKLFAIVRQYEALLQLCFIDPSLGIRSFYDEKNASKWQASEEFDVETLAKNTPGDMSDKHRREYHCRGIAAALRYGRNIRIAEQTVH